MVISALRDLLSSFKAPRVLGVPTSSTSSGQTKVRDPQGVELVEHFLDSRARFSVGLKLLGAVAGVVVENVLGELISRARRRGVGWLKLF